LSVGFLCNVCPQLLVFLSVFFWCLHCRTSITLWLLIAHIYDRLKSTSSL
jgi:hypothetical protein